MKRRWWAGSALFVLATLTLAPLARAGDFPDADRAESVAKIETAIEWQVEPAGVELYVDNKKVGVAGSTKQTSLSPGKHTVKLKKGGDEIEADVNLKKGEILKFKWVFEDG